MTHSIDDELSCPGYSKSEQAAFERGIALGKKMASGEQNSKLDIEKLQHIKSKDAYHDCRSALAVERGLSDKLAAALNRLIDNPGPRKMDDPMTAHRKLSPHIEAVSSARAALSELASYRERRNKNKM